LQAAASIYRNQLSANCVVLQSTVQRVLKSTVKLNSKSANFITTSRWSMAGYKLWSRPTNHWSLCVWVLLLLMLRAQLSFQQVA